MLFEQISNSSYFTKISSDSLPQQDGPLPRETLVRNESDSQILPRVQRQINRRCCSAKVLLRAVQGTGSKTGQGGICALYQRHGYGSSEEDDGLGAGHDCATELEDAHSLMKETNKACHVLNDVTNLPAFVWSQTGVPSRLAIWIPHPFPRGGWDCIGLRACIVFILCGRRV